MRANKTVVQFDMDGVLCEFVGGFTKLANEMGFGNPVVYTIDQQEWSNWVGLSKEQVNAVWREIDQRRWFWYLLPPLVSGNVFNRIHKLREHADVYFVTARHTGVDLRKQTEMWLKVYGIPNPTVVFTEDKAGLAKAVHATHSIDDKLANAVATGYALDTVSCLLDRLYNDDQTNEVTFKDAYTRIATVESFLDIVERRIHAGNSVNGRVTVNDGWWPEFQQPADQTRGLQGDRAGVEVPGVRSSDDPFNDK